MNLEVVDLEEEKHKIIETILKNLFKIKFYYEIIILEKINYDMNLNNEEKKYILNKYADLEDETELYIKGCFTFLKRKISNSNLIFNTIILYYELKRKEFKKVQDFDFTRFKSYIKNREYSEHKSILDIPFLKELKK